MREFWLAAMLLVQADQNLVLLRVCSWNKAHTEYLDPHVPIKLGNELWIRPAGIIAVHEERTGREVRCSLIISNGGTKILVHGSGPEVARKLGIKVD